MVTTAALPRATASYFRPDAVRHREKFHAQTGELVSDIYSRYTVPTTAVNIDISFGFHTEGRSTERWFSGRRRQSTAAFLTVGVNNVRDRRLDVVSKAECERSDLTQVKNSSASTAVCMFELVTRN
ncbi:hypothetical protein EVAR_83223_1 [Eumeta japonica]|uniref:Uncharacterized protein n=1 Tax=Eumeta variegata TaxID=151549 RepID=A0A4C1Y654_EUMVA|nr:hypothetical protein EVAR_83223_1 [Eumeta japonica]